MQNNVTNLESVIKQAAGKKKSLLFNFRKVYPAYIVLVLFIAASFVVKHFVQENVENNTRIEFNKAVSSITTRLNNHFERHEQVLNSMHGLYGENIEVVRDYFELYGTVPAKTYSSILSLSYVPYVKGSNWADFHFAARSQGYFDYDLQPAGERSFYFPVLHSVLFEKNGHRIGFDYASVPEIRKAIESSRDENAETATPAFLIRKDTLGFCIIKPIYERFSPIESLSQRRDNFQATLVLEIGVSEFFNTGLRGSDGNFFPTDSTVIFDYSEKVDGKLQTIFKSKNYSILDTGYEPIFSEEIEIQIGDRVWVGTFRTIPDFGGKFQAIIPTLSLIGSLLTSFLFFGFIVSVITSKARAEDLAERMTRSQRRILEATNDIIGVLDFSGKWKSANPAVATVLGYSAEEFNSMSIESILVDPKEFEHFKAIIESTQSEKTEKMDVKIKSKDDKLVWVSWSFTISKIDNLVYAIGRDVTLEKLAEQEAQIKRKQIELAEQFALEASHSKSFFMIKLSHQLRNSLTGIIGYLQLLSMKLYENEEEEAAYLRYAEQSSEEIFTFVSDIVDATLEQGESSIDSFVNTKIEPALKNSLKIYKHNTHKTDIAINIETNGGVPTALVSPLLLEKTLTFVIDSLVADMDDAVIEAIVQENHYEGATEIQLLGPGNQQIAELIKLYRDNHNNIISALKYDKNDVISNIAKAASQIRRMNGTMSVETFGGEEGNVVMITLPLVKRNLK